MANNDERDDFADRLAALRAKVYGEPANPTGTTTTTETESLSPPKMTSPDTGISNDVDDLTARFTSLFGTAPVKRLPPTTSHGEEDEFENELDDEAWERLASGGDVSGSGLKDLVESMTGTTSTALTHEDWKIEDILKSEQSAIAALHPEGQDPAEAEIARLLEEAKASLEVPTTTNPDHPTPPSPTIKSEPVSDIEDEEDETTQLQRILNEARDAAALDTEFRPSSPPFSPPSPPTSSALPTKPNNTTEEEEDDLTLRLLALRTDMPTRSLPFHDREDAQKAEESDDELWCTMCSMDGEFRCSGCDGEVYCENCLWESHQGPGAGVEEKRHKWTRMDRGRRMVGVAG